MARKAEAGVNVCFGWKADIQSASRSLPADLKTLRKRLRCERCQIKAAQLVVLPPV